MSVVTFTLGPLSVNCYVISEEQSAIVVDPGGEATEIISYLKENNLKLEAIILTHLHFDHLYGVAQIKEATNAEVLVPQKDIELLNSEAGQGGIWGLPKVEPFEYSILGEHEQIFGSIMCKVIPTPGHSAGGVSIFLPQENAVLTGDTLFYNSIGRTDLPGGNLEQLLKSIEKNLFILPPETVVYPGHGEKSTIGYEYNNNVHCGMFKG